MGMVAADVPLQQTETPQRGFTFGPTMFTIRKSARAVCPKHAGVFFPPSSLFLENKTKQKNKAKANVSTRISSSVQGEKTKQNKKPPTKNPNKPTKPLNCGSKAFNPT